MSKRDICKRKYYHLNYMLKKNSIFRVASLLCLAVIPLYPNIAYALTNSSGVSYMFTGLIFAIPVIALIALVRQKWIYCVLTSILTILAITDLTMVDLYKDYLLPYQYSSYSPTVSCAANLCAR